MDWANDNARLSHNASNVRQIFKYVPRPARAIKIVEKNGYRAQVWSLESHREWTQWLDAHTDGSDRGLVVILADCTESVLPHETTCGPLSIESWLAKTNTDMPLAIALRRETTFAPLGEKNKLNDVARPQPLESELKHKQRLRSIMHLPFARNTFDAICSRFQVHKSIVRTIARRDVPAFSYERVEMKRPAFVYNCRTPSNWASDLALSATYYPQNGLTFAIIYGSSAKIEKAVLERLQTIDFEVAHPLLLPGIIAELELMRHTRLVESSINDVEARIVELNFQSNNARDLLRSEIEHRNHLKRTSWLDLTYLRNALLTWTAQLLKMAEYAESLNLEQYAKSSKTRGLITAPPHETLAHEQTEIPYGRPVTVTNEDSFADHLRSEVYPIEDIHGYSTSFPEADYSEPDAETQSLNDCYIKIESALESEEEEVYLTRMRKVGEKIRVRLAAIRDDYDEKIRDCTMRVDGMAMATQWSHSETAVEIALATNQDSKVMRSISLVTMVFLPGTFFATVFSMTFFDWFDEEGKTRVSSYLWIYVVVTIVFTAVTIGLWYFLVLFRRTRGAKSDEESIRME